MQSQSILSPLPSSKTKSIAAKEQALKLMTQLEKAFEEGAYGAPDKPFEQALHQLIWLLKPRLGGLVPADRVDNPTHLVTRLLSLMSEDAFRNISQDDLHYQLAAALHAALDLVVIESYEESWITLPKKLRTRQGEIEAMKIIEVFERGKPSLAQQYELDCCKENIRALLEKKKDWEKVFDIIKLGIGQDIGGLLSYASELREEILPLWQVSVLLFRRLTPLAQQSSCALDVLQSVIADVCQENEFHCHYAAQEALAETIAFSQGAERIAVQRQALGQRVTADKIEAARKKPTYWYLAQTRPPERKAIAGISRKQKDRCRYRLIYSTGDLLVQAIENKEAGSERHINNLIEMLLYLQETEPAYLKEAKAWVQDLDEKIRQDKPKAFYLKEFEQAHPGLERKHLVDERECLKAELKHTLLDLKEQQSAFKKVQTEKAELENAYQTLLAQQADMKKQEASWHQDKAKLEEEKVALTQRTAADQQQVASLQRQCNRNKKQLEAAEAAQNDLLEELNELKQGAHAQIMQPRIQELNDNLKDEQAKVVKLNAAMQKMEKELQDKSEQLKQREEALAKDREALAAKEVQLGRAEAVMAKRAKSLEREQEKLKQSADRLKAAEKRLKEQQVVLKEREASLIAEEQAMALQIEEIQSGLKKPAVSSSSLAPPPASPKSPFVIKPWRKEPFDPDFCNQAEEVKVAPEFLCPVLKRPAYDAMILILATQEENAEGHLISDEAARRSFLEGKETTCPCCRQEVTGIMINRPLRAMIKSMIETALLAKQQIAFDQKQVTQVLAYVAEGQQDEAEALLKNEPSLALAYGTVTDQGGRTFKRITAFQYAVWALDWHMWEMMLHCFNEEQYVVAGEQYQELDAKGTEHGKQFNLNPLIEALEAYGKKYDDWTREQREHHWTKVVASEQAKLPMHVVNEYCRPDRSFEMEESIFKEKTLPRGKGREKEWLHYDGAKEGAEYKYTLGGEGGNWAWARANDMRAVNRYWQSLFIMVFDVSQNVALTDKHALSLLGATRNEQKSELRQKLASKKANILIPEKVAIPASSMSVISRATPREVGPSSVQGRPSKEGLFKPKLQEVKVVLDQKHVAQVLSHVAEGQQDEAEILLKKEPFLALAYGTVADQGGRTFKRITAFQYAVWALDWHMWEMMLRCFNEEHYSAAAEQYQELDAKGTEHGKQFSLNPLIEALQAYSEKYKGWTDEQREHHWTKVVAGEQAKLPMHVVNEYCRLDRSFQMKEGMFKEKTLPRGKGREKEWLHRKGKKEGAEYKQTLGGRGGDWAWITSPLYSASRVDYAQAGKANMALILQDRQALSLLGTTRNQQKSELAQQLVSKKASILKVR